MEPDKRHIAKAYDLQVHGYDSAVGRGIRALMRQLLGGLDVGEAPVALDVACGTGISTFALIEKAGGEGEFHGMDLSKGMLEVARRNAEVKGLTNVRFAEGDAENLDYPDAMFDVVICNMSFQFIPNKQRALNEMHRVLKPGGRLALLFVAGPMFSEVWEILEEVATGRPEHPGFAVAVDEIKDMHIGLKETEALMEGAGFDKSYVYARHRLNYNEPDFIVHDIPYAGCWKVTLPEEAMSEVVDEFKARLTGAVTERGFRSTWYVILAYGTKQ